MDKRKIVEEDQKRRTKKWKLKEKKELKNPSQHYEQSSLNIRLIHYSFFKISTTKNQSRKNREKKNLERVKNKK